MSLTFGVSLPQGWIMDLASIKHPIEAYKAMTRVAQSADELGFASVWLVDHLHTIPHPSQEVTFECWTTPAAIARDTKRVRVGQVTCNGYRNPALLAHIASTASTSSRPNPVEQPEMNQTREVGGAVESIVVMMAPSNL